MRRALGIALLFGFAWLCGFAWLAPAEAQTYPSRPMKMMIPLASGSAVDVAARKLVLRRVVKTTEAGPGVAEAAAVSYATKDGSHPARGALKGMIHIPPGVDLTEPADTEWADLVDGKYGPEVR